MFLRSFKTGLFLSIRQIKGANIWSNILIIFVMMLTFLNLVVVSGILVGIIEGSTRANRERYTSDIIISNFNEKKYIEESPKVIKIAKSLPEVRFVTARYTQSGKIEAGYKERTDQSEIPDSAGASIAGINPIDENNVTGLARFVMVGEYLDEDDEDKILIGNNLLYKYTPIDVPGQFNLKKADLGSKIRLTVNGNTKEVIIKGVLKGKVGEIDQKIFMSDKIFRKLIGRGDFNVNEIAIKLKEGESADSVKRALLGEGVGELAQIKTWEESQPKFLKDIQSAFLLLGNLIGSIGLTVASITIFIVIFVNAVTRRKFIGILKGIGINSLAIEISYIIQSLFYAVAGTGAGLLVFYFFLIPFVDSHPIDLPFSDGILAATASGTLIRVGLLLLATLVAGYIPAKIIVRQNTLDAILGR